jgi:hypothetical protein
MAELEPKDERPNSGNGDERGEPMTQPHVIEGTWEEIARHAEELSASGKRLKLIVPADETPRETRPEARPAGRASFGMFKGTTEATESPPLSGPSR